MLFFKERKNKIEYYEIVKTLKHTQFHGKFIVFFFTVGSYVKLRSKILFLKVYYIAFFCSYFKNDLTIKH